MLVKRFFFVECWSASRALKCTFWAAWEGIRCKKSFHVENRHIGQTGLKISATPNYINWLQPLQMKKNEKRKRNEHFRASWKGLMVKKSFRSFQKRQFEKRIFNQYYEYHKFVENQLNFKPILETKSAPFRTVRINRTTILGNQSTWDKSRVMHRRHFNRLFSAKKG